MSKDQIPVVLALFALAACVTGPVKMEPVSVTDENPIHLTIAEGDTVRVLTKHGDRPTFKITQITEDAVYGADWMIPFDDMAFIEKRTRGPATAGRFVAGLVLVAGTVMLVNVTKVPPGMPSVP